MTRQKIIFFLISLFIFSCSSEESEPAITVALTTPKQQVETSNGTSNRQVKMTGALLSIGNPEVTNYGFVVNRISATSDSTPAENTYNLKGDTLPGTFTATVPLAINKTYEITAFVESSNTVFRSTTKQFKPSSILAVDTSQ